MYSIYADGTCIYNDVFPLENTKVLNPKLSLEDSAAGSLSMKLPPANAGYSAITRLVSDISVRKDGQEIWAGRVLSEDMDFWNNRALYCEGELAFFNDSVQPPAEYANCDIVDYLRTLIEIHNGKVGQNRQFALGAVTVHDANLPTFYTNYEKTMELLNGLVEKYGGHLRVRKENGVRYLDYLADCPNTCTQVIQFGKNLIDFTRQWDMTEFATVIIPLGKRLDDDERGAGAIEALDAYLTVASVNDGKTYIQSDGAVASYGWIEKTVSWNEVEDAETLLEKGEAYLRDIQFDNMVLELSALDLHYLNVAEESVKLLDKIRVISPPHGLNRLFPVTKLEIPLDSPEKTMFKLGDTVRTSLTSVNNQTNAAILERIENLPKEHSVLKTAKENAQAIMDLATNGYITITRDNTGSEALIVSSEKDYTRADRYWKWNMNGLAYYGKGQASTASDILIGITMDGSIVADRITTGTMSADRVRTGVLQSENGNVVFNLDNGTLTMNSGSIRLGAYTDGHYQFEVTDEGRLYAGSSAIFAGTLNAARGSFGGDVTAKSFYIEGSDGRTANILDLFNKRIKSEYLDLDDLYLRLDDPEDGLATKIDLLPGQIYQEVSQTYVTNEGLRERLSTSVTLNPDGILISNATGQKFVINTANNISMSFSNLTDAQQKQSEIEAAKTAADDVDKALDALKRGIGYTYLDGNYVISPTIVGGTLYATNSKDEYLTVTSDGIEYYSKYSGIYRNDWYLHVNTDANRVILGSPVSNICVSTSRTFKVEAATADFSAVSTVTGLHLRFTA